jgi:type III secretory pathway component EscU
MIITLCCLTLFWVNDFSIFAGIFWLKIATLALTFYFINRYKKNEFYYFQNLGISKILLWATTLIFDFILFLFLIIMIYSIK